MNSISAGGGVSGRAAEVLAGRRTSGGSAPSKGGVGMAASVVDLIGTVEKGSMEGRGETSEG